MTLETDVAPAELANRSKATGWPVDFHGNETFGQLAGQAILALQSAAGAPSDFYDSWVDEDGATVVVYGYLDEATGKEAGRQFVDCAKGRTQSFESCVDAVQKIREENAPTPGEQALLEAARERNIPVIRRGQSHQLGWGQNQRHLSGGISSEISGLAFDIANDNERILEFLDETGIPLPAGGSRRTLEGCQELAEELRFPLCVKPLRGRGGVTPYVTNMDELEAAYDRAKALHRWVVLEDHIEGKYFEALVIDGELIGVVSEGNDVTDAVHPAVRLACERAAKYVGLDVAGIDIIALAIDAPLPETNGCLVGLNPAPDLAPFLDRGAADAVLDTMFEGDEDGRIPLVAITGTNGKTTTSRLVSHILKYAGANVGMACTGAVEVENQVILKGDYSGPTAARTVLQEPTVSHAVCEVARGGILKRGLGFDACDVAVFLNVASDHLGQGGINSIEDLARLKGVVIDSVKPGGAAVLNAEDDNVWSKAGVADRDILISMNPKHPRIVAHLKNRRNAAVVHEEGHIVLRRGPHRYCIIRSADMPLTLGDAAMFNIQNAMAATAVAYALGVSEVDCRAGLVTFNPSTNQLPGRMNVMHLGGVKVLIDYGHNVPALTALATVLPRLAGGRKINVADGAGNRRDEDLLAFGAQIATMYDRIYICDPDPRGRKPGETSDLIEKGVLNTGFSKDALTIELSEDRAFRRALAESRPGDLVVLQADNIQGAIELCKSLRLRLEAGESQSNLNEELLA